MNTPKKGKSPLGGVTVVAEMLNHLSPEDRDRLLRDVAKRDSNLAARIEGELFTFETLVRLDDLSIQTLLRDIPQALLVIALRVVSDEVKEAVFRNLSARARTTLRDEITSSGPRRLSDVKAAQSKIVALAKEAAAAGRISLGRKT